MNSHLVKTHLLAATVFAATVFAATVLAAASLVAGPHLAGPNIAQTGKPLYGLEEKPDFAEELMAPGPIEDVVLGNAEAPNVIVEYASMTCPHCAYFHNEILPQVKAKYIDTGKAKYIFREFPLDGLAARASMLARCAPEERFYPTLTQLFETQEDWALPGEEGLEALRAAAEAAGISQEAADACLADQALFEKVAGMRAKAHQKYGVRSTPSLFVNGEPLSGATLSDIEGAIGSE